MRKDIWVTLSWEYPFAPAWCSPVSLITPSCMCHELQALLTRQGRDLNWPPLPAQRPGRKASAKMPKAICCAQVPNKYCIPQGIFLPLHQSPPVLTNDRKFLPCLLILILSIENILCIHYIDIFQAQVKRAIVRKKVRRHNPALKAKALWLLVSVSYIWSAYVCCCETFSSIWI